MSAVVSFAFTEEQQDFAKTLAEYSRKVLLPGYRERAASTEGAAQASLDEAAAYATQRHTFGRPIADNQGVSFLLAEHATYLEAARWLCYRALWLREQAEPHTSQASMSKWWPPVVAKDAIEAAMRIHGNLGYATEFPLQQRFRDVMAYLVADGTAEIQKMVIAREILAPHRAHG